MKYGDYPFPDIVGMTLLEAEEHVDSDVELRVSIQDGVYQLLTEDIKTGRLNIVVESNRVIEILGWG